MCAPTVCPRSSYPFYIIYSQLLYKWVTTSWKFLSISELQSSLIYECPARNREQKRYPCSDCSYEANYPSQLRNHTQVKFCRCFCPVCPGSSDPFSEMRIRIRSDTWIFGPQDPVLFSLDPDPTCNNGFIKLFSSWTKYKPESTNSSINDGL